MSMKALILSTLLMGSPIPALAQAGPVPAAPQRSEAVRSGSDQASRSSSQMQSGDPSPGPTTRQLNHASDEYTRMRADTRAHYRMDRRAYIAAVEAQHDREVNRYDRRYARQQVAYAEAMAAWRVQVAACKRDDRQACAAPTPRVADFY